MESPPQGQALRRHQAILWISGFAIVASAILLKGTSHLLSSWIKDNDFPPFSDARDLALSLVKRHPKLSADHKNNYIVEEGELDDSIQKKGSNLQSQDLVDDDIQSAPVPPLLLLPEDQQRHRRLKRIAGRASRERDRKAEEAKARAMNMQPSVRKNRIVTDIDLEGKEKAPQWNVPRYLRAIQQFQTLEGRLRLDPLGAFQGVGLERVPFEPKVQYLGVLIDAGRHYFPIDWLKRLIVYLHRLRFNLIHFRLTDDQAFALQLKSYPELAFPSVATIPQIVHGNLSRANITNTARKLAKAKLVKNTKTYTPNELRELVAFARTHGIAMIPEINVPGHAGAWAGLPNMVVNCPEFVCSHGYGIPLNVEHPQIKTILKTILAEVLDIFDDPPLLHLGGDELDMSSPCFKELHKKPFNYIKFEELLEEILQELDYSQDRVLRWEETAMPTVKGLMHPKPSRAGAIHHFWLHQPGKQRNQQLGWKGKPFFVSHELYMDVNHESGAYGIYNSTMSNFQLDMGPEYYPTGMVAGTFELGTDFWVQRNVAARLIAVAMGTARLNFSSNEQFWNVYNTTCRKTLGLDASICDLQGYIAVSEAQYHNDWSATWIDWKSDICDRMTDSKRELAMSSLETNFRATLEEANQHFWRTFKSPIAARISVRQSTTTTAPAQLARNRDNSKMEVGIILDLVNAMRPTNQTMDLIKTYIAPIGIDLVQIRLADNYGFAIDLEETDRVGYFPYATYSNPLPPRRDYANLVREAGDLGIEVYPEITLSTNAGGWVGSSGFALNCPMSFCYDKRPDGTMATNIGRKEFLPVVYSVIRELMDTFVTSRYIHLGSDERRRNLACFREDGRYEDPPFDVFERDLSRLLNEYLGISTNNVLRWENEEKVHYSGRTGRITHYRPTSPFVLPNVREKETFFVTIDLLGADPQESSHSIFYEIYKNTRQLVKLQPQGILAETRNLDKATWSSYFVGLRLLAFKIGTEHLEEDYTPELFQKHLIEECRRVRLDKCEEVSKGEYDLPSERLTYLVQSEHFRDRICSRNTEIVTTRVAKEVIH